uniref:Uncharacterized protein n=1 Tax=Anopheles melas TaxID=34690 RepID=A0A182TRY5_9DIPT
MFNHQFEYYYATGPDTFLLYIPHLVASSVPDSHLEPFQEARVGPVPGARPFRDAGEPGAPLQDGVDVAACVAVPMEACDAVVRPAHARGLPVAPVVVHSYGKGAGVAAVREDWVAGHHGASEALASTCVAQAGVLLGAVHDGQGLACEAAPDFDQDVAEVPAGKDCAVKVMVQGFAKVLVAEALGCSVA